MPETRRVITKERLAKGYSYQEYMGVVKANKELFEDSYAKTQISEDDKKFFVGLTKKVGPITVMALGEDWCPDVYTNLSIVQRIVEAAGNMNLRIFPRDENLDIMNEYLNNGFMSIPMIAFFDENLNELGRWVERTVAATKMGVEVRAELTEKGLSQEEVRTQYRKIMAEAYQTTLRAETVREIRQALSK